MQQGPTPSPATPAAFTGLIDLAAEAFGGRALATSDDFFAGMENLVKPGRGEFRPDEYTDHGKWMDGWESRRKRAPGHDWCIVALGAPGVVRALDIDTNHFLGNHPPYASLDGVAAPGADAAALARAEWTELLPQSPLRPGAQNLFAIGDAAAITHVRLNIFPDGGVARLRVYGEVEPTWDPVAADDEAAQHVEPGEVDLAAARSGGLALACSDMFFGPMNNLLAPGRAADMGGGWETRRRRGEGYDWILVRLGAPGRIGAVEVDTNHFKGNYPDRCSLDGVMAPGARITDLVGSTTPWQTLLPQSRLGPHRRHFFREELVVRGPFSHVRLNIFPDGGVSRLRLYGTRAAARAGAKP